MIPEKNRALVEAALSGDLDAFGSLVSECRADILRELTGLMGCPNEAEDILQEALLRGYLRLSTLREPYNFGGWMRQIARNMARNRITRRRRHIPLEEGLTESTTEGDRDHRSTLVMEQPALKALSRLSSKLRETARLTYLSSLSQKQVAHRLGVPLGTVKRRLWEGRGRMKEEIMTISEGSSNRTDNLVPAIGIIERPNEEMSITAAGPGLYFGTVLKTGHTEVCSFFDYPGGILTQSVQTNVVRKVEILGRQCYEVLIRHSDCEPREPNLLDYFQRTDNGFNWIMRVVSDAEFPATRFMAEDEEVFPMTYSSGSHRDYTARVVDLKIADRDYGRCLAVLWGRETGTPAESYYTSRGRQVLHRRYVGPEAPASGNYDYDRLLEEHRLCCDGVDYRLWYDTVLIDRNDASDNSVSMKSIKSGGC